MTPATALLFLPTVLLHLVPVSCYGALVLLVRVSLSKSVTQQKQTIYLESTCSFQG